MDLQALKSYCMSKKGARETFPFDDENLVFKVGSKMFALTNIKREKLRVNLKCDPYMAADLRREFPEIIPGYHMNKTHWNTVFVDGSISEDKVLWLIDHSYQLVFKGLKKSEREIIEKL